MQIIVRDAAVPGHPVIGIAALGSSVAQQTVRDELIGWCSKTFLMELQENPSQELAKWLLQVLEELIEELYFDDLLKGGIIDLEKINNPADEAINLLRLCSGE